MNDEMCQGRVWNGHAYNDCGNRGKFARDGKHYCGRHDPVAIEAKRFAKSAAYIAMRATRIAQNKAAESTSAEQARKAACFDDLLAALLLFVKYDNNDQECGISMMTDYADAIEAARAAIAKATTP